MPQSSSTAETRLQKKVARLKQHQAQADALFASIGDGAIATDETGRISKINQPALTMLGFTEKEVIGKWFPKVIIAEDENGKLINPMQRPITQAFLAGQAVTSKMRYRRKDGSRLPVAVNVSPIILDNAPIGAVEVFRDITHEQEVDRMKTEFIYLASHQLRTPLTAIKTYAHMLYDGYVGELTPQQKDIMRTAFNSIDRMNDLINTLLNISRVETGKIALTPSAFQFEDIIHEAIEELQTSIERKNIQLAYEFEPLTPLTTDAVLAKEVVNNLLSNAVKYTPHNGKITISLSGDAHQQTCTIKDSGYGIPEDVQSKLFTKFFRAPNIVDKEEGGSGLGLYLVKGLADALRADISFTSKENEGSCFSFSLPTSMPMGKNMEEM